MKCRKIIAAVALALSVGLGATACGQTRSSNNLLDYSYTYSPTIGPPPPGMPGSPGHPVTALPTEEPTPTGIPRSTSKTSAHGHVGVYRFLYIAHRARHPLR